VPPNSIPVLGGQGPFDYITMGGLLTILQVRNSYSGTESSDNRTDLAHGNRPYVIAALILMSARTL
jgi:hypothetical protein